MLRFSRCRQKRQFDASWSGNGHVEICLCWYRRHVNASSTSVNSSRKTWQELFYYHKKRATRLDLASKRNKSKELLDSEGAILLSLSRSLFILLLSKLFGQQHRLTSRNIVNHPSSSVDTRRTKAGGRLILCFSLLSLSLSVSLILALLCLGLDLPSHNSQRN